MTSSAKTVFYFGIYVLGLGLILLVVPNVLLGLFGFEETKEPWVRVLGAVVAALGYYYMVAAKSNARPFFNATIHGRVWILLTFIFIAVLGLAKPILILFGMVDLVGAIWTWKALKSETQA